MIYSYWLYSLMLFNQALLPWKKQPAHFILICSLTYQREQNLLTEDLIKVLPKPTEVEHCGSF